MRAARADRLWLAGGALAAAVLLAVGWFVFVSPQHGQTGRLRDQAAAAELRLSSLRHRLAEMRAQNDELPEYRAQLARDYQALPTTSGLSDFLRELQAAGDGTGVAVTGFVVGAAAPVTAAGVQVYALPITLTVTGRAGRLNRFLDQLQRVQPRAVLVGGATAVPAGERGSLDEPVTLTVSLRAFVAPANASRAAPAAARTS